MLLAIAVIFTDVAVIVAVFREQQGHRGGQLTVRLIAVAAAQDAEGDLAGVEQGDAFFHRGQIVEVAGQPVTRTLRVIAAIRDEIRGGRELRLVLKDGETRERTVTLGEE